MKRLKIWKGLYKATLMWMTLNLKTRWETICHKKTQHPGHSPTNLKTVHNKTLSYNLITKMPMIFRRCCKQTPMNPNKIIMANNLIKRITLMKMIKEWEQITKKTSWWTKVMVTWILLLLIPIIMKMLRLTMMTNRWRTWIMITSIKTLTCRTVEMYPMMLNESFLSFKVNIISLLYISSTLNRAHHALYLITMKIHLVLLLIPLIMTPLINPTIKMTNLLLFRQLIPPM